MVVGVLPVNTRERRVIVLPSYEEKGYGVVTKVRLEGMPPHCYVVWDVVRKYRGGGQDYDVLRRFDFRICFN